MMYTAAAKLNSPTAQHVSLLFGGQQSALGDLQQLALETLYTKGTAMVVKELQSPYTAPRRYRIWQPAQVLSMTAQQEHDPLHPH